MPVEAPVMTAKGRIALVMVVSSSCAAACGPRVFETVVCLVFFQSSWMKRSLLWNVLLSCRLPVRVLGCFSYSAPVRAPSSKSCAAKVLRFSSISFGGRQHFHDSGVAAVEEQTLF